MQHWKSCTCFGFTEVKTSPTDPYNTRVSIWKTRITWESVIVTWASSKNIMTASACVCVFLQCDWIVSLLHVCILTQYHQPNLRRETDTNTRAQLPPLRCTNLNEHICVTMRNHQVSKTENRWKKTKQNRSLDAFQERGLQLKVPDRMEGMAMSLSNCSKLLSGTESDSDEGRKRAAGSLLHHLTLCLSCWVCFRLGRRPNFPRHSPSNPL